MRHISTKLASLLATIATAATPAMAAEVAATAAATGAMPTAAVASTSAAAAAASGNTGPGSSRRCTAIIPDDQPTQAVLGKSVVIPLKARVVRIVVSGQPPARAAVPAAAAAAVPAGMQPPPAQAANANAGDGIADVDVTLLSPTDLFFRGRQAGSMNVVLQSADGTCYIKDVIVTIDPLALQAKLAELMPDERRIRVRSAEKSIVLTGEISDALKLDDVMNLASAYGADGKKVVNLLRVATPQQVMLEVKIAEVSKTLLDRLGSRVGIARTGNGGLNNYSLISNFLSTGAGLAQALRIGRTSLTIDGQKDDGLVRILAEPNIMAISGQQASFLSGGKIFIPVAQNAAGGGGTNITLEEKEFGIGVKFTPTVLNGDRVNLKLVSEVSDLTQTGSPFTTVSGVTAVLPSLTVRRADTTVQLNDGQSFVIAGLIKSNVNETIKRYPGLGEVPVMGALFRSTEFQNEQTELMFVITPRLVKPLAESPRVPTDNHVVPSRAEVYLNGALESSTPAPAAPASETP
ncbi:type II and III secretion system protein family protein [Variovorax sp. NFACC27]|uniref:Type II and III secretion system protein family protein n=2 Tax=Comamonadaceae TaxID=80864 RepID=A0A3S0J3F5_9BURK|nr:MULTISPECIES: type II and III secretion system protein family protein [Variovorax]MDP9600984.1 pilus assembly protein CpaC [Variovorax paradoxus]SEF33518.1 pilus assembly protein CpaC [Variovorax sp. NFACC28]SEG97296.1 pilus assembly protein CpaC [Variovorax sp. NFACC29]SFD89739.1 pilus assembly protein CpaC [Variovorax sp. NFACC26]SFH17423.1 pilus assembly protein CpaC [Variovorax sp. NFACC27]